MEHFVLRLSAEAVDARMAAIFPSKNDENSLEVNALVTAVAR